MKLRGKRKKSVKKTTPALTDQLRQSFFDNSIDLLCIAGFDGYLKDITPAWSELLGWSRKELLSRPYLEFVAPEDRVSTQNKEEREKAKAGEEIHFENRFLCKDGSVKWIQWNGRADAQKEVFFAVGRDITEHKRVTSNLRQSEMFLNSVIENIPHMIFIKEAGDLRFLRFNRAGEKLLGFSQRDLLGKNDYDFFPAEQADFFTEKDRQVLREKKMVDIPAEPIQTQPWGQRILHTKKIPLVDDAGQSLFLLGISEDITERKALEDALQKSHDELERRVEERTSELLEVNRTLRRLASIPEHSPNAFVETDENGAVLYINASARSEFPDLEAKGFNHAFFNGIKPVMDSLKSTAPHAYTYELSIGGRIFEQKAFWLPDSRRLHVFCYDLTERKRAEAEATLLTTLLEKRVEERTRELTAINAELEAFSYSVSHDLRAPLRAIMGFAQILFEDHEDKLDADGKRVIQVITSNIKRMSQLIDDLLLFSRLGRKEFEREIVDMDILVREIIEELKAVEPERSIQIEVDALPSTSGDPVMIRQVWTNLLSNAFKFTRPKESPRICVRARDANHAVIYEVEDNGVGFDMRYKDKLFGVFQRLHRPDEFEGTGVGLAIVQRIIHRHGGRVEADSRLQEGTTMRFSLPRKGEPA